MAVSVSSLAPMVDAVLEVLCDGAGVRCLVEPKRFRRWTGRGSITEAPPSALRPPAVSFRFGRILPGEDIGRNADGCTQRYEIAIDVGYAYEGGNFLGGELGGDSIAVMKRLASDQAAIKFALEEHGNLDRTVRGLDTGIVSGLLEHVESVDPVQIDKPDPTGGPNVPQRIIVTHRFIADVQLARPA